MQRRNQWLQTPDRVAQQRMRRWQMTTWHCISCAKRKSPCARVKIETTMRSDAGSTAPTESERVKLRFQRAKHVWWHVCGRKHLSRRIWSNRTGGYNGGNAIRDGTGWFSAWKCVWDAFREPQVAGPMQWSRMSVLPFWPLAKTSQQTDWFEFDEGYDVILPGPGEQARTCEGLKCGKVGGKPFSVLVARIGSGKHGWSTVEHDVQSGKVSCWGNAKLCDRIRCNTVGGEWGNTQSLSRQYCATWTGTNTMHVIPHIFSPGHGVERQWIKHTDLRQAGTRVKTGEGRIISSRQTRQIHTREKQSWIVWSRMEHFQPCRWTELKTDWWVHVKHSGQLTWLSWTK